MIIKHNNTYQISSNNDENIIKGPLKSSHSTDTEPEAEVENKGKFFRSVSFVFEDQDQQKNTINKYRKNKNNEKNVFLDFIELLPTYEYDQEQIRKNQIKKKRMERNKENKPMNLIDTNNNRFLNYYEAFLYIGEHCVKHDQKFTRETCKQYLKQCYIIDFAHDNFIPITTHLTQKLFNKYFRLIQRELKFI